MSASIDLERRLATWLEQDGPADVPAAAVEAALAQARTIRQRRARLTRTWWDRRPLVAAPAPVEAGAIEPGERIPTFPVARSPLRPAWVLLLLAGLLAALVGGTLLVGSQTQRRLPAVVPPVGQLFECPPGSTPDEPGPVDQARPPLSFWSEMAFDRRAGRLVVVTGTEDIVETWTFDVCANSWTRMHPNREPPSLSLLGTLVYDIDSDVTVALDDANRMWAYDLGAKTWTEKGPAPADSSLQFYDPVSGLVVALGDDGDEDTLGLPLWGYEVETDTWTPIPQAEPLAIGPHYEFFAYDPSVDRLVAYANTWGPPDEDGNRLYEARTWLFDIRTGTWSGTSAVTPGFFRAGYFAHSPAIADDEAAQRTVMLGQGYAAAYDATADRWETLYVGAPWDELGACGSRPECRQMPHLVYDPVNERLVAYGGDVSRSADPWSVSPDDVLAFETRTREWTVLLEASEGHAAP